MEMKKFEEYLKEAEGDLNKITLFKLTPTNVKQLYKIEKSYEQVADYQKVLDVINGNDEGFYISNSRLYSTKDMLDFITIDDEFTISQIVDDDNVISLSMKRDVSSEGQFFNDDEINVKITYDDNDNIIKMSYNSLYVYYYEYDEFNRVQRSYNDNPFWCFMTRREVDKPWDVEYDDENNTSFNQRTSEYTKYDENMNKLYSVVINNDDNSILSLKKYIYGKKGIINIINIELCCGKINKFNL